jgi:glycosyltransferase involved in cell wall biosynthesis
MKKRILIIGDSAALNTGYGVVCKNIGNYIIENSDCEVKQIGLYHHYYLKGKTNDVKFEIISQRYNALHPSIDKYGQKTFQDVMMEYCPHVVITIGDPWHLFYVNNSAVRNKFTWISYIPVDGEPYPKVMFFGGKWLRLSDVSSAPDINIAFTDFGKKVLEEAGVHVDYVIPHGVDTNIFFKKEKANDFSKQYFSSKIENLNNITMFGFVGRNQLRKNIPSILKAWSIYKNRYKNNEKVENSYLYIHTPADDTPNGFNLSEIILNLNEKSEVDLRKNIILPNNLRQGNGLNEVDLNNLYNSFDCLVSGTMGEGWGLTHLEAMAVGVPTILPDYSGHLHYAQGVSWLIPIKDYFVELISSINRAIIDENTLADMMKKFVDLDKSELSLFQEKSIQRAKEYDWSLVNQKWLNVINEINVEDFSFDKETFGLKPQDKVFIDENNRFKIVAEPIDNNLQTEKAKKIGYITTYNEKCGIATYSRNLKDSIEKVVNEKCITVFSELKDYSILFDQIVKSNIDILHWQHEPGIIFSDHNLMKFLMELKRIKPNIKNVFTLHSEAMQLIDMLDGLVDFFILHKNKINIQKLKHTDFTVIEHPVYVYDEYDIQQLKKDLNLTDKFVIGSTGFMTPAKSLDAIFSSIAPFMKQNKNVVFYFLNALHGNEDMRNKGNQIIGSINDIAKEYNIQDQIIIDTTFHDRDEMAKRIQTFNVGISFMPFDSASHSGSIAEMVGNKIPVICSNVTHFGNVIKHGICFAVNDSGNANIFGQMLINFLSSIGLNNALSDMKNKISSKLKDLSYDNFAEKHIEIYNMI